MDRKVRNCADRLKKRIEATDVLEECEGLIKSQKQCDLIASLMAAVKQHGVDSQAFVQIFDQKATYCAMAPAVTFQVPAVLLWAR